MLEEKGVPESYPKRIYIASFHSPCAPTPPRRPFPSSLHREKLPGLSSPENPVRLCQDSLQPLIGQEPLSAAEPITVCSGTLTDRGLAAWEPHTLLTLHIPSRSFQTSAILRARHSSQVQWGRGCPSRGGRL